MRLFHISAALAVSTLCLCISVPIEVRADEPFFSDSGNAFLEQCGNAATTSPTSLQCLGYLRGFHEAFLTAKLVFFKDFHAPFSPDLGPPPCYPDPANTLGQDYDVVINYLRANPQDRQIPLDLLAWRAEAQSWPCKTPFADSYMTTTANMFVSLMPKPTCIGQFCFYWKEKK
jgi:hypothetical protein